MELTGEQQGIGSALAFSVVSAAFETRVYESERLHFSEQLNFPINASSSLCCDLSTNTTHLQPSLLPPAVLRYCGPPNMTVFPKTVFFPLTLYQRLLLPFLF